MRKRYKVIYADPPWSYDNKGSRNTADKQYTTTGIDALKRMMIAPLCDADAVCFMWVTFPMLQEGIDLLRAWGFEYKTVAFVWVKQNPKAGSPFMGMGNWTRTNAEMVIMGTRGSPKRLGKGVHQIIEELQGDTLAAPRAAHSVKPRLVADRIVELMGDVPRLEMFARAAAPGWDLFGNEAPESITIRTRKAHG